MENPDPSFFMTVEEAAKRLGIARSAVLSLSNHGMIRVRRFFGEKKAVAVFPYRVDVEARYRLVHFCRWCEKPLSRTNGKTGHQYCSNSCRGKTERAHRTKEQHRHVLEYRRNSKWWLQPGKVEKHRQRHRDWYERIGRIKLGHARRGEKFSLPEKQVRELLLRWYKPEDFKCNDRKTVIGTELDFYHPTEKWAIDIRGIYHFKPIFGQQHLDKVMEKDLLRIHACVEKDIRVLVIPSFKTGRGGLLEEDFRMIGAFCGPSHIT